MPVPEEPPVIDQGVTLARYPFLPQASGYIAQLAQSHQIDLDELLEGEMMEHARKRARIRLIDAIESKDGVQSGGVDIHTEEGRVIESFSFYFARLVMCATEDERLISRWAQAEATRAEKLLQNDKQNLELVARTYFSDIDIEQTTVYAAKGQGYVTHANAPAQIWNIGLIDFLEVCPKITGPRWRLPNMEVRNGWIQLFDEKTYSSSQKIARLLRERIKSDIEQHTLSKISEVTGELAGRLAEPVGMVKNLLSARASEALSLNQTDQDDWPPCMNKIIQDLAMGVNVNHFGRLFLASMSSTLKLPTESCVDFFRGAPDFSESTTTYQVDHVYSHEYTPAGCGKLKVNHNCPVLPGDNKTCDQPWMDHPLKYIRAKQRWKKMTTPTPHERPSSDETEEINNEQQKE